MAHSICKIIHIVMQGGKTQEHPAPVNTQCPRGEEGLPAPLLEWSHGGWLLEEWLH